MWAYFCILFCILSWIVSKAVKYLASEQKILHGLYFIWVSYMLHEVSTNSLWVKALQISGMLFENTKMLQIKIAMSSGIFWKLFPKLKRNGNELENVSIEFSPLRILVQIHPFLWNMINEKTSHYLNFFYPECNWYIYHVSNTKVVRRGTWS